MCLAFTDTSIELQPPSCNPNTRDIVRKFSLGASEMLRNDLTQLGGSWLTAFFLAGLLVPFVDRARTRMRWLTLDLVAAQQGHLHPLHVPAALVGQQFRGQ